MGANGRTFAPEFASNGNDGSLFASTNNGDLFASTKNEDMVGEHRHTDNEETMGEDRNTTTPATQAHLTTGDFFTYEWESLLPRTTRADQPITRTESRIKRTRTET